MADYQKMYTSLFNQITDVIEQLKIAQLQAEALYMNSNETAITIVEKEKKPIVHTNSCMTCSE